MPVTPARPIPPRRLALAGLLALVYAAPLFFPPGPSYPTVGPDAGLLARLYPGVPGWWVAMRLGALLAAAVLLGGTGIAPGPTRLRRDPPLRAGAPALRWVALAIAGIHAASGSWAAGLGPGAQSAYLLTLFAPAALLAWPAHGRASRGWLPIALVIALWIVARLTTDLQSARVADAVDGWRGWVDIVLFSARAKSMLSDLFDPELPGLGAILVFFHGMPLYQSGLVPLTFRAVQILQIVWLAVAAAGLGVLARMLVGRGAALIAVAVLLFAPYTRLVALFPGPFIAGPLYGTAIALAAVAAWRRRSEAALAALGALSGIALTYPGMIPPAGLLVAWTIWQLRGSWRTLWAGFATGLASFVAAVTPAAGTVLTPSRMAQHLNLHGIVTMLEPALLGQLPVGAFEQARAAIVWRPLDIVAGALLEPFANPRTAIRLWGDAIFDPLGAALIAIGLVACVRSAPRAPLARFLLLFFLATLCPAFVSPVDRVDIVHAIAIPVPAALLAAVGFATVARHFGPPSRRLGAVLAAVLAAAGGTVLFDVVNPRILSASATGVVLRVVEPTVAPRVIVLDYARTRSFDVRWLYTGAMTAFAGAAPVGFLEYDGGPLPLADLAAAGKDLVFWSPGLEQDLRVEDALCAVRPDATLYEIRDEAGLGRVYGARIGAAWEPAAPAGRVRRRACPAR